MVSQNDLVIVSYPFSDLVSRKVRPAIVISNSSYNKKTDDVVAVPLITKPGKQYSIVITNEDLESGELIRNSTVRVDKILNLKKELIRKKIAKVKPNIHREIIEKLLELVN